MKRLILPLFAAAALTMGLTLAGCETATPYQPLGAHNPEASGGFSEQQIDTDHWRVTFAGNDMTSRDTVERYLLYRSAELTLSHGSDWFATTDRATDKKTDSYIDPAFGGWGGRWGPRWGFYRPGAGWGPSCYWRDPFCRPYGGQIEQENRYRASAEIVIGKGPKPADKGAFDARSVIEHLGPTVERPKG